MFQDFPAFRSEGPDAVFRGLAAAQDEAAAGTASAGFYIAVGATRGHGGREFLDIAEGGQLPEHVLDFPAIDADLYIPALLEGFFGSKKWMAARLGAEGGKTKTVAKARASRENGRLGGRPKKSAKAA